MGVDADIYALNAKKKCDMDRLYHNVQLYNSAENVPKDKEHFLEKANYIYDKHRYNIFSYEALKELLEANVELASYTGSNQYRASWSKKALKFIEKYKDDKFRIIADNEDIYYEPTFDDYELEEIPDEC